MWDASRAFNLHRKYLPHSLPLTGWQPLSKSAPMRLPANMAGDKERHLQRTGTITFACSAVRRATAGAAFEPYPLANPPSAHWHSSSGSTVFLICGIVPVVVPLSVGGRPTRNNGPTGRRATASAKCPGEALETGRLCILGSPPPMSI